jgi:hypothetical protein
LNERHDHEADNRDGDQAADDGAQTERRRLEEAVTRGKRSGWLRTSPASPWLAATGGAGLAAGGLGALRLDRLRLAPVVLRARRAAQRKPNTIAIAAPIGAITNGLTIRPTRMHATPPRTRSGTATAQGDAAVPRAGAPSWWIQLPARLSRVNDVTIDATGVDSD